MAARGRLTPTRVIVILLALALSYAARELDLLGDGGPRSGPTTAAPPAGATTARTEDATPRIAELFREARSGVMVDARGEVAKLLPDDNEGSRHQRFILRLEDGNTVLIAHNIDLAPRIPIERGEELELRGQYEWNERGGVIHWTHRDPDRRHPGGWIRHRGNLYQ